MRWPPTARQQVAVPVVDEEPQTATPAQHTGPQVGDEAERVRCPCEEMAQPVSQARDVAPVDLLARRSRACLQHLRGGGCPRARGDAPVRIPDGSGEDQSKRYEYE
jgi:hypothetical protein